MASGEAWNIGAQQGANAAAEQGQHKRNRQEQMQDEERNNKLQVYANLHNQGRIGTSELGHAIEDIYHDAEPEKKMNIFRRLLNRQKATKQHDEYLQGRQKRATEEQGILAGAKTPGQVESEQTATTEKTVRDILSNPNLTDEQKRILSSLYGAKTTGPTADANKRADYQAQLSAGSVPVDPATKQPQTYEAWVAAQSAGGRAAGTPKKPLTPSAQYANLLSKKILADKKQGPALTNEENAQLAGAKGALTVAGIARANAFAQAAAANNLTVVTDENGEDVLVQRSQAVEAAKSGKPMTAGIVGAPTAHDEQTQQYAISSLDRLKEMRSIVNKHPEIFGPAAGRTMKASVWLGTQSPEAQKFRNDAQFLAEHSTAVFGGRAASTVEELKKVESDPSANPDGALAGFDSDESTLNDFINPSGRLPAPKKSAASAKSKIRVKLKDGRTGTIDASEFDAKTMTKVQ